MFKTLFKHLIFLKHKAIEWIQKALGYSTWPLLLLFYLLHLKDFPEFS